jgi:lysozyme family protein
MSASSWDRAIAALLASEGGYVNHPDDPGGPTRWGITLADARRHWKPGATADDVRRMPEAAARAIYRERYWNALRCNELPSGIDYAVFDYGVNSGVGRAGRVLRRVLGLPDRSGAIDRPVCDAAHAGDAAALINAICAERMAFLRSLKTFAVFGRGWTRRVAHVRSTALALASEAASPSAERASLPAPPATRSRDIVAGGAAAGGAAAAAAASAHHAGIWFAAFAVALTVVVALIVLWRRRDAAAPVAMIKEDAHGLE